MWRSRGRSKRRSGSLGPPTPRRRGAAPSAISSVVAELRAGFALESREADNERLLRRLLSKDDVDVLFADEQTTYHYASVYRQLRRQGTPIPTNDMWIAALVLQHDLALCSRDAQLDRLTQIPRV